MFEPVANVPNLLLATDRDGQHRLCAAVQDRRSREIVATAVERHVTLHKPRTDVLADQVAAALAPFLARLDQEGVAA